MDCGEPAAKLRNIVSAPNGSTPKIRQSGFASRIAVETPGRKAAAADRDDDGLEVRHLFDELEAERAGAHRGAQALEGMHERALFLVANFIDAAKSRVKIRLEHDLAAEAAALGHAKRIRALLHHDLRARADRARREGGGDRVVARADRANAAGALGIGQRKRVHQRAARLEAAGVLEKLELERHARAGGQRRLDRGSRERLDRRLADPVAEERARRANLRERQPGRHQRLGRHAPHGIGSPAISGLPHRKRPFVGPRFSPPAGPCILAKTTGAPG